MAALPVNFSLSLAFVVLAVCCYGLVMPAEANNMEAMKSELKDGNGIVGGGSGGGNNNNGATGSLFGRRSMRSIYGLGPKMLQISRSKIPIELDLLVENEDGDRSKRFDDYGHMRFGKRGGEEQFDDYGHMRFGRSA